jgi:translation initiation factor 2 subunit 2
MEVPVKKFDFGKKKRPQKRPTSVPIEELAELALNESLIIPNDCTDPDYKYEDLLDRLYERLPKKETPKNLTIEPPKITKFARKTVWVNFEKNCQTLGRSREHLMEFINVEVVTTSSINGQLQLVINSKLEQMQIEQLLRKYIAAYVRCTTCKQLHTLFKKEYRLTFIVCQNCQARRTVSTLKAGVQLSTRASRKAAQES